ncbi:MAG: 5-carboxymethyl-2-hydroxymuconate Delta-isomerase, partial [Ralstonia mannitolilytica]
PQIKKAACDALFEAIKAHFAEAFARRYLALSMELTEFDEGGSYKHNNIHARFRKA